MENPPIRIKPILERRGRTMKSNKAFLFGWGWRSILIC